PHRGLLEGDLLFLGGVRGVIGGDAVDRPVEQSRDQGLAVGLGAQRRVHLVAARVEAAHRLVGEAEMVGRDLAGDLDAGGLSGAHGLDRLDRREVLDVDAAALVAGDRRVTGDHRRLRDRGDSGEAERGGDGALVHDAGAGELGILPAQRRWYWSARRRTRALVIGRPSSLKPAAPASRSEAISVSSSPRIAWV